MDRKKKNQRQNRTFWNVRKYSELFGKYVCITNI